ncbi:hypothetical protein PENTCL1PPCAC_25220, partial [Pristionchus entomophagus]
DYSLAGMFWIFYSNGFLLTVNLINFFVLLLGGAPPIITYSCLALPFLTFLTHFPFFVNVDKDITPCCFTLFILINMVSLTLICAEIAIAVQLLLAAQISECSQALVFLVVVGLGEMNFRLISMGICWRYSKGNTKDMNTPNTEQLTPDRF